MSAVSGGTEAAAVLRAGPRRREEVGVSEGSPEGLAQRCEQQRDPELREGLHCFFY